MEKCPDCQEAENNPNHPIFRSGCRQCAKRQLKAAPQKDGLASPQTWVGVRPKAVLKEKGSVPTAGTLEMKILVTLLKAWHNRSMLPQDVWKFDIQDFDRVDRDAAILCEQDHGLYSVLVAHYRLGKLALSDEQTYQTDEYYRQLGKAHEWMLEHLKDVIQKHMWKKVSQ